MSFDLINGYNPRTWSQLIQTMTEAVNQQFGTSYQAGDIVGTNFYKFFYGGLQMIMQAEQATTELSSKLTDFIRTQNEIISLPKSTTDGFLSALESELGVIGSFEPITDDYASFRGAIVSLLTSLGVSDPDGAADTIVIYAGDYLLAGRPSLCVDLDPAAEDYEANKQAVFELMHKYLTAGLIYRGTETTQMPAVNGQLFDYALRLPTPKLLDISITVTISNNSRLHVMTENEIRQVFLNNFNAMYRLGYAFEPEKYLEIVRDCPFAANIATRWRVAGSSDAYSAAVLPSAYNELITLSVVNIEVI